MGKYISGNCSEEEKQKIDQWINEDPEHARMINDLKAIWEERPDRQEWDAEEGWNEFLNNLEKQDHSHLRLVKEASRRSKESYRISENRKVRGRPRFFKYRVAAAAVLFLVLAFASLFIYDRYNHSDSAEEATLVMQEIVAEKGQRSQFKLNDGTKIWLNGGSTIKVSAEFNSDIRKVYLEGEAFFDVASDPKRPFIIEAGQSITQVLGTKFGLQAYPDEDIRLVVQEGKVAFGGVKEENTIEVASNKMALMSGKDEIDVKNVENLGLYIGWVEGRLIFKNTPFKEVLKRLNRWYGIKYNLVDSSLTERTITGEFRDEAVSEVLDLITLTMGIDYEKKDGHITFMDKEDE
ncbi:FecR family protein [Fodinibius salsisoli]|uniref:FecR domain-containing protein n=1 Tax=Fodinibius salsisoli TaxID=2820877 RepID=A0ABT3PQI6_9BACT|nr:FecR domain-containing protein [Fodinibius salsisoli]MCW9708118.1 FecR domain-containing protein [Fodinibius salsisoli]